MKCTREQKKNEGRKMIGYNTFKKIMEKAKEWIEKEEYEGLMEKMREEGIIIGYEPQTKTICLDAEKYWGWQVTDLMEAIKKKYQVKHAMLIFLADKDKDKGTKYEYYYDKTNEVLAVKGEKWEWYREEWAEEYCRQLGKKHPAKVIESLQWLVKEGIVKEITVKGMKILPKKDYLIGVSEEGEVSIYVSPRGIYLPAGNYPEGKNYVYEKVRDAKGEVEIVVVLVPEDQKGKEWHDIQKYEIKTLEEWLEEKIAELDKEWDIEGVRLELGEVKKDCTIEYGYDEEMYVDADIYINVVKKGCRIHKNGCVIDKISTILDGNIYLWGIDSTVRDWMDKILVLEKAVKGKDWKWPGERWLSLYFKMLGIIHPAKVIESLKWLLREGIVKEITLGTIKIEPEKEYLMTTSHEHTGNLYEVIERLPLEPKIIDDKVCTFYKVKNVEGSTCYLMKYPPINKEPSECPYTPKYGAIEVIDWLKKKLCRAAWKMYIYDKNFRVYRSKKTEGAYEIITYEKDRKIGETIIQIQDIPESVYTFIEEFTRKGA
ncbi:MAG: hypothetical protein ACTSW1_01160 [Candidatus Hodarchaeales archaeon]